MKSHSNYTLVLKNKKAKKKTPKIYTICRNTRLRSMCLGCTFIVYNGKTYLKVFVCKNILEHKLGEFSQTRSRYFFKKKKKK